MYTGVTEHKNSLGTICMVFGLAFLWCLLEQYQTKRKHHRLQYLLAYGIGLAMAMWLLWMSDSATSSSCFFMAAALLVVPRLPTIGRRLRVVHLMVAVFVCISLFALFFDTGGGLVESLGRNPTLTGRTAIWRQVVNLAGNSLFGAGNESFWLGDRLQKMWSDNPGARLNEAHNGYLEVYLNLGWCGVTLLAVLIVTGYQNVIIAFRRDRHIGGLKVAYFLVAIIYSFTEAGFRMISPTWIIFLLATTAIPNLSVRSGSKLDEQVNRQKYWLREYEEAV